MIVTLNIDDGYYTGNKHVVDPIVSSVDDVICIEPDTNSFAWDVKVNDGDYNISLNIEWPSNVTVIKKGTVTILIHYLGSQKKIQLKNKKLVKKNGNKLDFNTATINTRHTNGQLTVIVSSLQLLKIISCQIQYQDALVVSLKKNYQKIRIGLDDEHPKKDFKAFYREFNCKNNIPYTQYHIIFNKGGYTINSNRIKFNVFHVDDYESFIVAKNEKITQIDSNDNICSLTFPYDIKSKNSYKLFLKT